MATGRICLGMIVGVHGVRGHLKIKAYTGNPPRLINTDQSLTTGGLHLNVKSVSAKGHVIAMARDVTDRERRTMRGLELFINRDALPIAMMRSIIRPYRP